MKIEQDTVVMVRWRGERRPGQAAAGQQGTDGLPAWRLRQHLPAIEEALDGHEVGYQTQLSLAPGNAFGLRDESLVRTIPKASSRPA
jgi:FKBP-type peptidyl-prolyl cis-trans isomerase SlyD